jgi:phosphatidylinositol-3-phosphatase
VIVRNPGRTCAVVSLCVLLAACADTAQLGDPGQAARSVSQVPATVPRQHIVVIVMENKRYSSIMGSRHAPFMNALARRFGRANRYFANDHPSLPNYLNLIAGHDFGINDNGEHYRLRARTLVDQLEAKGLTWRAYMEGMRADRTAPCPFPTTAPRYAKKHNPFAYFVNITSNSARCRRVVPLGRFKHRLARGLPNFTWITPGMCHSMHDCSIASGDAWLRRTVPPILRRLSGRDLLFVVFDEGLTPAGGGGHIACIVAGPGARRGAVSRHRYSHFSLLKTIESEFGLRYLRHARNPRVRLLSRLTR